jgi:hypothetical protein
MSSPANLLELIPDTPSGKIVRYCFDELVLSSEETTVALRDAYRFARAIDLLLRGAVIRPEGD